MGRVNLRHGVLRAWERLLVTPIPVLSEPGISYSALPMYLGELAPKNLRGTLGTMTEVFVIIGVLLAQIFSLQAILGNTTGNQQHVGCGGER